MTMNNRVPHTITVIIIIVVTGGCGVVVVGAAVSAPSLGLVLLVGEGVVVPVPFVELVVDIGVPSSGMHSVSPISFSLTEHSITSLSCTWFTTTKGSSLAQSCSR